MKVLIIGGGGREHALCWKLAQSPRITKLWCAPGNAGIASVAECRDGDPLELALELLPDLVVVGPEEPLSRGLVDRLADAGIAAFGPNRGAARLEASNIFCKELLKKYDIPTAGFETFAQAEPALAYLRRAGTPFPIVIKADGLAAGKGVVVAQTLAEAEAAVEQLLQLKPGGRILIEEGLVGQEVSLIALYDGATLLPLVAAQDHKRIGEGDTGANTGGMGCYSPVPAFTRELQNEAITQILEPTLRALESEGIQYRGALYAGLMLTASGIRLIEYNCRFGDPETQVILPRLRGDLLPLLLACAGQGAPLAELECQWTDETAVCVVMAAAGYPAAGYRRGDRIEGLDAAAAAGALVFHAGTANEAGAIVTHGGRVLGVTARGNGFAQARRHCYADLELIRFEGAQYRRDIGWRCL